MHGRETIFKKTELATPFFRCDPRPQSFVVQKDPADFALAPLTPFETLRTISQKIRNGKPLPDFNAFPLRIMETSEKPKEAILKLGFSDGLYGRSKGGQTFNGWSREHLPYLVEFDNYGVSRHPGEQGIQG